MNANRMKYATTPTYGLQKRGAFGKKNMSAQANKPETPDFSQAPDTLSGVLPQTLFSMPPQRAGFSPVPFSNQPFPPFFPQGMNPGPAQGAPAPYAQANFSAPIPNAFPQRTAPMNVYPPMMQPPLAAQPNAMPPLGNTPVPAQSGAGFSPRSQGFVPPRGTSAPFAPPQAPAPVFAPSGDASFRPAQAPAPTVQSAGFMGGAPMPVASPYAGMMGGAQAQGMGFMPDPQSAYSNRQPAMPFPPASGEGMPPAYSVQKPVRAARRVPMDADRLWSLFLFGALPLLFLPCLFVPQQLNLFRYCFLALCVGGVGAMWYRRMYGSTARVVVSAVAIVLCVATVFMLTQGGRDIQQTSANVPATRQTAPPDQSSNPAAAPAATEATPTPAPTSAGKSEAQMRLETFMSNWQGNRVEDMVGLVQPSWATAQDAPNNRLFMLLANRTPEDFTIEDISGTDEDTSRTVTMTATINKNNGKDPILYRFMVLMVKEGGEWYVDPNSLATNAEVESEEEVVVNNRQSAGIATEPPRSTVSPAPPASTTLYYNPDGGHFYHKEANCTSIKSEYLPLQGSFPYSELSAHSDLQPCLVCGAPTKALSDEDLAAQ